MHQPLNWTLYIYFDISSSWYDYEIGTIKANFLTEETEDECG